MVHRRFRLFPPIRAAIAVFVALTCVAAVAAVGAIEQADPPVAAPGGWSKLGEPGFGAIVTSLSFSPTDSKKLLVGGEMNGVFYSSDNGVSVRPALGLRDYEVGEFTWHPTKPDEVWVGTMGGAYVSRDGGVTWSAARAGFPAPARWCYSAPVEKVLFDPTDATHLVAIGGSQRQWTNSCPEYRSAIWDSVNGGLTWKLKGQVLPTVLVTAAAFTAGNGKTLLAATQGAGIWRSVDAGGTWVPASFGLPHGFVADIAVHPKNPLIAWTALGAAGIGPGTGGVYKTIDGGLTWLPSGVGLSSYQDASPNVRSRYHEIRVSASNPDVLYTSDVGWAVKQVYRSANGGASWAPVIGFYPPRSYNAANDAYSLAVDPRDPNHIAMGNEEIAFVSDDAGAMWRNLGEVAVATGGWHNRGGSSQVANHVSVNPFVPGMIALSGFDGGNLLFSADNGTSWRRPLVAWDGWGGSYDSVFASAKDAYVILGQAGIFNGLAVTHDAGLSWAVLTGAAVGLPERGTWAPQGSNSVSASGATVVAVVAGSVYRSTNAGVTWVRSVGTAAIEDAAIAPNGSVWAATRKGIVTSADGGVTFAAVPGSPAAQHVAFDTLGRVYVVDWQNTGLWRFDGTTWTNLRKDPFLNDVAIDPTNPKRIVAVANDYPYHDEADATGVWVSTDDGVSWSRADEGLAMTRVATVAFDANVPGRVLIGTYGNGFWERNLNTAPAVKPIPSTATTVPAPPAPAPPPS